MAMAVKDSRQQQNGGAGAGVKVKFIETQFISSDAASFKAVVQRLTGKSPEAQPSPPAPQRPRPWRPAFSSGGVEGQNQAGWAQEQAAGYRLMPAKQEPHAALAAPPRLEEHHELCDFADLLYATAGTRRDGGSGFPY
ncbi:uncharacterized protein LOC133926842 [Phragmites australis]|uniref:uncharacterized protein LOC133926842 n=1 Tax=Phragmites australis TaxID=29695 RepID=UPI002D79C2CE|nr:uncharacterized protein LOC133926842 [Phragmites australis]